MTVPHTLLTIGLTLLVAVIIAGAIVWAPEISYRRRSK